MIDFHSLLQSHETETIEFKERWEDDRTLRSLAAFANTQGGVLLVGVADNGRVVGWECDSKEMERISNKIIQNLRIHPVRLKVEEVERQKVLVIQVAPSASPVAYHGHYFRRAKQKGHITNREYRELTKISDEGFRKDMTSLVEKKIFKPQGKGRSTRYILVQPGD